MVDPLEEALRDQRPEFAAEVRRAFRRADSTTKADILAFFSSDGPARLGERVLKAKDGTPTTSDLENWMSE